MPSPERTPVLDLSLIGRSMALLILIGSGPATTTADEPGPGRRESRVRDIAEMKLVADGGTVSVELTGPALELIGFEHTPRTDLERRTLAMAERNLRIGDAMIRFNIEAGCRLDAAEIETDLPASAPGGKRAAARAHSSARLRVRYRFRCDHPAELGSAALGLFAGFPALERVLVHYVIADGQGSAESTPARPTVSFVPF